MAQYSVHTAKTNLSRLIAALDGGEVIITRRNLPVVQLGARGKRRFGARKTKIAIDARFDAPQPEDEAGLNNKV